MLPTQKSTSLRSYVLVWDNLPIVFALLALAGLAWADMYFRAQDMGSMSMTSAGSMEMSTHHRSFWENASLFLPMWTVMMAAMMLPSMLPMVLSFSTIYRNRGARSQSYVPTWVFLAGYMLVWTISGVPGYLTKVGLESVVDQFPTFHSAAAVVGGVVLIGAGAYQLSPLKG